MFKRISLMEDDGGQPMDNARWTKTTQRRHVPRSCPSACCAKVRNKLLVYKVPEILLAEERRLLKYILLRQEGQDGHGLLT